MTSYRQLEQRMVTYRDLITIPSVDDESPLVRLDPGIIPNGYLPELSAAAELGPRIIVRARVADLLLAAQRRLHQEHPGYRLWVAFGYRTLDFQTERFREQLSRIAAERFFADPQELYETVHRLIAVPTVAGHPTGGAVDVFITDAMGTALPCGTPLYDFSSRRIYTFAPGIGKRERDNRLLLRRAMTAAGFAPFDGEWWHFSYGDREWAYYYRQPQACYAQLPAFRALEMLR